MPWWLWTLLGLYLLIQEVFTPTGFYVTFFGIGAFLVGGLVATGLVETPWVEWFLFSVLSVAALLVLRRPLVERLGPKAETATVDSFVGELAVVLEDIPSGGNGKAELRGTSWNAHNTGSAALAKGQRCRVERIEGLTLGIRAESNEVGDGGRRV